MTQFHAPQNCNYINGEWKQINSGRTWEVINPADETVIINVPSAGKEDVCLAVQAAKESFDDGEGEWAMMTGSERAVVLREIAASVKAHTDRLAMIETLNMGKPLKEARWDMDDVAGCFDYYASQAELLDGKQDTVVESPMPDTFDTKLQYIPTGVVGAVIPWNYPLLMASWKLAPALAAGCSVVIKPSELTPLTLLELAQIIHEEVPTLPRGVLNVITGDGLTGGLLTAHEDVDKVAFTGSLPTGIRIMQAAAQRVANITLELGGKSSLIIFDDVDVDTAVEWALFGCFWTNGQICSATSRVLIQNGLYDRFISRLVEVTSGIPVINPNLEETFELTGGLGPLVSAGQYDRVTGFIKTVENEDGVSIISGGARPEDKPTGYFLQPTIIEVTNVNATVWNEEIFGPVMSVMRFDTEKDAIRLANQTKFGLAGGVMTNDVEVLERVAKKLRCGIVWKNCSQPCFCTLPWGGLKLSGIGRELGSEGMSNYLQVKSVVDYISPNPWGWYINTPRL